jgi:hypothetical protein
VTHTPWWMNCAGKGLSFLAESTGMAGVMRRQHTPGFCQGAFPSDYVEQSLPMQVEAITEAGNAGGCVKH